MSQPAKWWWGLIPLALIWIVSNFVQAGAVREDLSSRALEVTGAGVHAPSVAVSGRDVTLSGTIFSPAEADAVAAAVGREWGVRKVSADLALPPVASPFGWELEHAGDGVVLTGAVPDPAARQALLAAAQAAFPQTAISDETVYAAGAPQGFAEAAGLGIEAAAELEAPRLVLSDGALSLSGRAPSASVRDDVLGTLESLPQGFTLAAAEIEAPAPYGFTARREGDRLTLSGGIPGEELRARISAAVGRLFPGDDVVDELTVAQGAPQGFADAVLAGLAALSRLVEGAFSLAGEEAELAGAALYEGAAGTIRAELDDDLPAGFAARTDGLTVRPVGAAIDAAACQSGLDTLLGRATILFETGETRISRDSAGLLDRIVATLARCPETGIEIAGHTDSVGSHEANVALSQARAQAVLDYLAAAGLEADGFAATGYGPDRPVASNDTEEGRASNRRIEFIVR